MSVRRPLSPWQGIFALTYLAVAALAAWRTVQYTSAEAELFDQISEKQNLRNEGTQVAEQFKEKHKVIGRFVAPYLRKQFHLPSTQSSNDALAEIDDLKPLAEAEGLRATFWSRILLGLSLAYLAAAASFQRWKRPRNVLFALAGISCVFFLVGISAPAMMISTTIKDFFGVKPVLQHEVRSIFSVIVSLFSKGHWLFATYITLFSIATPAAKIALTYSVALIPASPLRAKISVFLHAIDKWSMADVFVAAVVLACFTIKSGKATQVIPCYGLYYFAGYALLSMVTTSLLGNLNSPIAHAPQGSWRHLRMPFVGKLVGAAIFISAVYSLTH